MITESAFMAGVHATLAAMEPGQEYYLAPATMDRVNALREQTGYGPQAPSATVFRRDESGDLTVNGRLVAVGGDAIHFTFALALAFTFATVFTFTFAFALTLAFATGQIVDAGGNPAMVLPEPDHWFQQCQAMARDLETLRAAGGAA